MMRSGLEAVGKGQGAVCPRAGCAQVLNDPPNGFTFMVRQHRAPFLSRSADGHNVSLGPKVACVSPIAAVRARRYGK